jgi:UDP-3-O-[3-hydroxymyristoyl] glucosamine N-acyltransferase
MISEYSILEIANLLNGKIEGNKDLLIRNIAKIEEAGDGDLSFLANPKYFKYLNTTKASAVIVSENFESTRSDITLIRVNDPYYSFLRILEKVEGSKHEQPKPKGIHPSAVISPGTKIGKDVFIGPCSFIGENSVINDGSIINAGSFIGNGVNVGKDTLIYPNVVIREGCSIGNNVIIHSGTVIGSDGFGFVPQKDGSYQKLPQLGGVIIEDDVEIGSNCSVDRATLGNTTIKKGTKLDNLIQVAHNVIIGENTVIAAQSGISGSTKIGRNCIVAGQVGFVGHIDIADNVTVGAQSGVSKSLRQSGIYFGSPAKGHKESLKIEGALRHLPELLHEFQQLKNEVTFLKTKIEETGK